MQNKNQHNLVNRPPVVVVMGHIDHGKSTLLDYIRKSNIVAGEAGGITQHMGAYEVEHTSTDGKKHKITFLDTPGHAAFSGIRARGAQAADVAILAVSAEDGVKPQTLDALKNIKAQNIPYVVAITKTDKPNADVDRTKQSLGENEIYVEGWGGDIPVVPISATQGTGINDLLDMIILISEISDLKSDLDKPATGIVIETGMDSKTGISATLLLKDGSLKVGDFVVAGGSFAPVRYIDNFKGNKISIATASMPARVLGWSELPVAGTDFEVAKNKKDAEAKAEEYRKQKKVSRDSITQKNKNDPADNNEEKSEVITLPLIIKADAIGSLEGIKFEFAKITHDKVRIKVVAEGIGAINENDVKMALGDLNIIIIGFNVKPDSKTANMIERSTVPINIKTFNIIYELAEYVKEKLLSKVPKEFVDQSIGRAKILALFSKEKDRQVLGGKVESGTLSTGNDVKITRRDAEIGRGKIRGLQSKKVKVDEVSEGFEFGMMLEAKIELAPGDRIEAFRVVEK